MNPLFPDVQVREYRGRFNVQLELPASSTLTPTEIDEIGNLASWNTEPNDSVDDFEGGRSVVIARERAIAKHGIDLSGLQISGIGYKDIEINSRFGTTPTNAIFLPPSHTNLMERVNRGLMSTSYFENGREVRLREGYAPLGTYTQERLENKVRKTMEAGRFRLEKIVVPHVEAYGRFLNPELSHDGKPFGFIVFPVPYPTQRVAQEVMDEFSRVLEGMQKTGTKTITGPEASLGLYYIFAAKVCPLIAGLRETHDSARVVHLQTHLGNSYNVHGTPYLVDWSTFRKLGEGREDNILNRVVDLKRPADDFVELLCHLVPGTQRKAAEMAGMVVVELFVQLYSGEKRELRLEDAALRAGEVFEGEFSDFQAIVQWMKDLGIEGFPKHESRHSFLSSPTQPPQISGITIKNPVPKPGRNDPCPCGSGRKYKRCCRG